MTSSGGNGIMSMEPLYYKVKKDIEDKILNGTYKRGDFIPSEPELEKNYKVSRTTIRKAINILVNEGYMTIIRGTGTKVSPTKLNVKTSELMSFTELMKMQGMTPSACNIRINRIKPTAEIISALEIMPAEEVYEIYRIRTADEEPISTNTSYIPCKFIENYDLSLLESKQSLYRVLEENFNIIISVTEDTISAIKAHKNLIDILHVGKDDPILKIERRAYDKNNNIIEYSLIYIRADRYKHTITLRRR